MSSSLNSEQRRAVDIIDGPLLILAGAWSGKTHTLIERVYHMINTIWISPESILCVTFTNKAAKEMRERIAKKLGRYLPQSFGMPRDFPLVSTFHSMGVMFLRLYIDRIGYERNFAIYDTDDSIALIKTILEEKRIDPKEASPRKIQYEISLAKNSGLSPEGYAITVESHFQWIVAEIYPLYQKKIQANNALDFDDILGKTLEILRIPQVLEYFHNRFQYFCVDEYQDTNSIQYEIIELLASKSKNLCVVGDDWQGIYSWRGANIKNIINFNKDFPKAEVVKLEQNYRSTSNIINAANVVIKNNISALDKHMWTEASEGDKIEIYECSNDEDEANKIWNFVEKNPSTWAILYRTNGQSRLIEKALNRQCIPYEIIGGVKFYDRKEIKDIIAYLRIIFNPHDSISWKRIVNTPTRKIGPTTIERTVQYIEKNSINFMELGQSVGNDGVIHIDLIPEMKVAAKWALSQFCLLMQEIEQRTYQFSVRFVIENIIQITKYQDYLEENYSPPEVEAKIDTINELKNLASRYDELPPRESLMYFLSEIALMTDEQSKNWEWEKVVLMTIHSAKGLEFEHVIIAWAEEGIFPHSRTLFESDQLEEERRLFYVAMTRAKKKLIITRANERFTFGTYSSNIASRFVAEIPEEYREDIAPKKWSFVSDMFAATGNTDNFEWDWSNQIAKPKTFGLGKRVHDDMVVFSLWDRVMHPKFWQGTIISLMGDVAQIAFSNGIKSLNIRIAPLTKA